MELSILLIGTVNVLMIFPVTRGDDNNFSGNGDGYMYYDETSPTNNKILVKNTFHLSKTDVEQLPKTEIIDERGQVQDNPKVRATVYNQYNSMANHLNLMETRINSLIRVNKNIVGLIRVLEGKFKRILNGIRFQNGNSTLQMDMDLMDSLEMMNTLNNIQQLITISSQTDCRTACAELIEPSQIQIFKNLMTAVASGNKDLKIFQPIALNQVLGNNMKSLKMFDKIAEILEDVDERTTKMHDISYRQLRKIISHCKLNENIFLNNDDDNYLNSMKRVIGKNRDDYSSLKSIDRPINSNRFLNGNIYDGTFQSKIRNRSRVLFEPNKYNCHDIKIRRSGIYRFASMHETPNAAERFFHERYCDFDTDGVAWTVIQRRFENEHQLNFNRSWLEYKYGFGELDGEFWFGNDFIHKLTFDEDMELRIILEDSSGRREWAEYSLFRVDSEEYNYNLMIGGYRGSIPDTFLHHNDQDFSTYDRKNDRNDKSSCASSYGSGWWYNNCTEAYSRNYKGIVWENWLGSHFLKSSKMMVRPKGFWTSDEGDKDRRDYVYTSTSTNH